MKIQFRKEEKVSSQSITLVTILFTYAFLSGCSSSIQRGESLVAADEMMEGPGLFSGEKGGFYLVGGKNKVADSKPVSKMNMSETSKVIDKKLEQLKRDQIELEALKKDLNKKLQN